MRRKIPVTWLNWSQSRNWTIREKGWCFIWSYVAIDIQGKIFINIKSMKVKKLLSHSSIMITTQPIIRMMTD